MSSIGVDNHMENKGMLIGIGLLLLVCAVAWLLGRKANAGVRQFREENHDSFLGRGKS